MAKAQEAEDNRRLVERVAESDLFQRSPRLREFLLYVAECTLANHLNDVREQVIARRVFGRTPEAGVQDTIVRAEARNLRKRLDLYFRTEGAKEPAVIVMAKGGYSLAFPPRPPENEAEVIEAYSAEACLPNALDTVAPAPIRQETPRRALLVYRYLSAGLAILAIATCGLAIYWHSQDAALREQVGAGPLKLPFSALFSDHAETLIVASDTGFLQISSLLRRPLTLDEYVARSYPPVPETNPPDLLRNWNLYEFTDGREMVVAGLLLRRNAQFARRTLLRSGHAVQFQDFKDHNVILIGSPISNPWAQLYEEKLNFRCELAKDGRITFRNRSPRRGESGLYPNESDIQHNRTYARLVFLPKTSESGSTMLIAGTTAQATQTAGEVTVDDAAFAGALKMAGIKPSGPPQFFEILIRTSNFVGGAIRPEVVAWRLSSAAER